jgi:hypothetical protein
MKRAHNAENRLDAVLSHRFATREVLFQCSLGDKCRGLLFAADTFRARLPVPAYIVD